MDSDKRVAIKVTSEWKAYLNYLIEWAYEHQGEEFEGMTPASYDEWFDNEYQEEE